MELLLCPVCRFRLAEPVTVCCGHTFCKRCTDKTLRSRCPVCAETLTWWDVRSPRNCVVLSDILEKCSPEGPDLKENKCRAGDCLQRGDFQNTLLYADKGLRQAPYDASLWILKGEAYMGKQLYSKALELFTSLLTGRPLWMEGFFEKGKIFWQIGQNVDALLQYRHCLMLDPEYQPVKEEIHKILHNEMSPFPENNEELLRVLSVYIRKFHSETEASTSGNKSCFSKPLGAEQKHQLQLSFSQNEVAEEGDIQHVPLESFDTNDQEVFKQMEDSLLRSIILSDLECPLCIRLFYEPVTTPCGHTFCKSCIERSLDHNVRCPLCKQNLREYLKNRKYNRTLLLEEIMSRSFPLQLEERRQVHEAEIAELSNLTKNIPIFVCTMAYPGIPCPLHIFEPRYRLMMRRCMETGTKRFGMCTYQHGKGFAEYGCMLEIQSFNVLPDGRSYVDTVGGSRFRVLRRGQRDGYHTADVEYLEDQKVEGEDLADLQSIHDEVYHQAQEWYSSLPGRIQSQIILQQGQMPETEEDIQASSNGPLWCWWLLSVLQLEPAYQIKVLSLTSLKDRLCHLRAILEILSKN